MIAVLPMVIEQRVTTLDMVHKIIITSDDAYYDHNVNITLF